MVTHATETSADTLIARYIEPHGAKHGKVNYRLKAEYNGVPVRAIIGAMLHGGATPDEVMRGYEISREAFDAALLYYLRNRAVIDAWLLLNQGDE